MHTLACSFIHTLNTYNDAINIVTKMMCSHHQYLQPNEFITFRMVIIYENNVTNYIPNAKKYKYNWN